MANVLVLGANGFIGSHLVDSLVAGGHTVRAFDRFSSRKPQFKSSDQIEVVAGDYLNLDDIKKSLDDIEYVFHFISTTTPVSAENDPSIDINTNIRMSVELFKLCAAANIKKVIFASTGGSIYGDTGATSYKETEVPYPVSPYAIGKLTIEHYLRYFRVKHQLDSICLRISNPYGERQPFHRKQGVIPIFLECMARNQPITVFGDGSMVRDYIYVRDLTDTIAAIFQKKTMHDTYNMGSGVGTDVNQLVDVACRVSGKFPKIDRKETPSTFVRKVVLDTTRFKEEFGQPVAATSLEDGMRKTYDYITQEISKE
ncbi:MAG TPA: NAD-dependent epimerase/dehydratase family protein [Candidatus Chromulinivoraceae bacterium]|nr:NAD-dependent epimerase/dehydratase family protein [Candidatus Chromulinivoraceae bacterium]